MSKILETHFKLIDFTKELLFKSQTKDQEEQARRLLEQAKENEKTLKLESIEGMNYKFKEV